MRRNLTASLRQRLSQPLTEIYLSEKERNPIDLIRAHKPKPGDVFCLFDLERAFPEALGYLDFQRETLTDMGVSLVCWVTPFEHRELAHGAPNFYAFRTALFDFTTTPALPSPDHPFFGRKREKRELAALLQAGGTVVLTGLGGVGKTALAQVVVNELRSHFVGGTIWINCETKPVLEDILLTVAVGLIGEVARQYRPEERRQRLEDVLRDRACLLVLDNFETIAEDSAALRWLKTIVPPSSVLVISRQSVPYLNAPTLRLAELPNDDAVQLFTERARDAGWDGAGSEIAPRLCALVGNLPLALQLLAPRAAELPLVVLEEMVSKNLVVLAIEKADVHAERQQSIAACFRVSFDRLSAEARTILTRLSVPPDGLGATLVDSFTGITNWQQPLAECVRHSLINFEGQRYRFHPLVRRFALEQLGDSTSEWQPRFVAFFSKLVQEHDDISNSSKRAVLDAEWRNAIAAAATAEELQQWQTVIVIAESLGEFLDLHGMWTEQEQLNKRALAAARATQDRAAEGRALGNLGNVYQSQRRWAEAIAVYEQSLAIKRELGDRYGEGQTLENIARLRAAQGDLAGALDMERAASQVLETTEDETAKEKARQLIKEWEQQLKKLKAHKGKGRR
jgi:tetratricopeptide (TPR) repeat protein